MAWYNLRSWNLGKPEGEKKTGKVSETTIGEKVVTVEGNRITGSNNILLGRIERITGDNYAIVKLDERVYFKHRGVVPQRYAEDVEREYYDGNLGFSRIALKMSAINKYRTSEDRDRLELPRGFVRGYIKGHMKISLKKGTKKTQEREHGEESPNDANILTESQIREMISEAEKHSCSVRP